MLSSMKLHNFSWLENRGKNIEQLGKVTNYMFWDLISHSWQVIYCPVSVASVTKDHQKEICSNSSPSWYNIMGKMCFVILWGIQCKNYRTTIWLFYMDYICWQRRKGNWRTHSTSTTSRKSGNTVHLSSLAWPTRKSEREKQESDWKTCPAYWQAFYLFKHIQRIEDKKMSRGLTVCFPYGAGVECSCGTRGRILRSIQSNNSF